MVSVDLCRYISRLVEGQGKQRCACRALGDCNCSGMAANAKHYFLHRRKSFAAFSNTK